MVWYYYCEICNELVDEFMDEYNTDTRLCRECDLGGPSESLQKT